MGHMLKFCESSLSGFSNPSPIVSVSCCYGVVAFGVSPPGRRQPIRALFHGKSSDGHKHTSQFLNLFRVHLSFNLNIDLKEVP